MCAGYQNQKTYSGSEYTTTLQIRIFLRTLFTTFESSFSCKLQAIKTAFDPPTVESKARHAYHEGATSLLKQKFFLRLEAAHKASLFAV